MAGTELHIARIFEEIKLLRNDLKEGLGGLEDKLLLRLEDTQKRVLELEATNITLNRRLEALEKYERKNSIVIFGLKLPQGQSVPELVIAKLNELLETELSLSDVDDIYAFGSSDRKTIRVRFISYLKKRNLLKNCGKLKGSDVFVSNDLTYKEREEHRFLKTHQRLAKLEGKAAFIRGNTLIIEGEPYTAKKLQEKHIGGKERQRRSSEPSEFYSTPEAKSARVYKSHKIASSKHTPVATSSGPLTLIGGGEQSVLASKSSGSNQVKCQGGKSDKSTGQKKNLPFANQSSAQSRKKASESTSSAADREVEVEVSQGGADDGKEVTGRVQTRGRLGSGSQSTK